MNTQKGFSTLLGILLILVVLGGGVYFYMENKKTITRTEESIVSTSTPQIILNQENTKEIEETSTEENQTKNLVNNKKIENCKSLDTTYYGDEIENCIINLAVEENNISYCETLNDKYGWDSEPLYGTCLSKLAVLNNSSSYCDMYVGKYKEVVIRDCYKSVSSNIEITEKPFDEKIADKLCRLVPNVVDYYSAWGGTFSYSEEENFCKSTDVLKVEDDFKKVGYKMNCKSEDKIFIVYFEKDGQGYCMDTKNTNIVA